MNSDSSYEWTIRDHVFIHKYTFILFNNSLKWGVNVYST